jgi:hypothetical protein
VRRSSINNQVDQSTINEPNRVFWSHDPYNRRRPVSTRIGQAGYGFGPYNLRPFKWPVLGLTVRCRHPYKPGRTPVKYGTARSPRHVVEHPSTRHCTPLHTPPHPSTRHCAPFRVSHWVATRRRSPLLCVGGIVFVIWGEGKGPHVLAFGVRVKTPTRSFEARAE